MLIRQILEHKKGVKAVKYNKKPKAHTPAEERKVIGPDVPKKKEQDVAESTKGRCMQCGMKNCSCPGNSCKCKPIAGWVPGKGFKKAVDEGSVAKKPQPYHDPNWIKNLPKEKLDAIAGPRYKKDKKEQGVEEAGYQHGLPDPNSPDLGSSDKKEFKRRELQHELGHERNNIQVSINGRPWKVFPGKGTADSPEEYRHLQSMKNWAERKSASTGKKWTVYLTGAEPNNESIAETATPGATSAGNVAVLGMNPKLSPGPARGNKSYTGSPGKSGTKAPPQPKVIQPKGKHGTAKNALDMKSNIFGGGKAIKRK